MTITVKLEGNNSSRRRPCFCCGEKVRPFESIALVRWDDEEIGHVCTGCVWGGQDKLAPIMRDHAASLRERAANLLDHAGNLDELADRGMPLPTVDEYRKAVQLAAIEYRMDVAGEDRATAEREIGSNYPFEGEAA